jgi:hypothetical protein
MTNDADPLEPLRYAAAEAVTRGSLIFHLELARTLALERLYGDPLIEEADGWAVDVTARGYEVIFLGDQLDLELATVTFAADGAPIVEASRGATSQRIRAMAAAAATLAALPGPSLRAVVIVPPTPGSFGSPLDGYLLRLGDTPEEIPLGPHSRFTLSPDGRDVTARTPLAVSDLVLPSRHANDVGDVTVTHLLGDTPSEVHVYLGLRHGITINVITTSNDEHWSVEGESISLF